MLSIYPYVHFLFISVDCAMWATSPESIISLSVPQPGVLWSVFMNKLFRRSARFTIYSKQNNRKFKKWALLVICAYPLGLLRGAIVHFGNITWVSTRLAEFLHVIVVTILLIEFERNNEHRRNCSCVSKTMKYFVRDWLLGKWRFGHNIFDVNLRVPAATVFGVLVLNATGQTA